DGFRPLTLIRPFGATATVAGFRPLSRRMLFGATATVAGFRPLSRRMLFGATATVAGFRPLSRRMLFGAIAIVDGLRPLTLMRALMLLAAGAVAAWAPAETSNAHNISDLPSLIMEFFLSGHCSRP